MSKTDLNLLARALEPSDEDKHQLTLAGLSDVDAGRTIPAEEVKQWVQSLLRSNYRLNSPE